MKICGTVNWYIENMYTIYVQIYEDSGIVYRYNKKDIVHNIRTNIEHFGTVNSQNKNMYTIHVQMYEDF